MVPHPHSILSCARKGSDGCCIIQPNPCECLVIASCAWVKYNIAPTFDLECKNAQWSYLQELLDNNPLIKSGNIDRTGNGNWSC